ncbi:tetraspanin-3-like isoform X1 [Biomphalaria glabrata]|uniref:Tetraspanin n=1 Tax=Biomphalaria glabrata TaxID=6526 RepID=A0A9W2YT62_BIOGL|nr:tetraspanin-3-like isoform X1 [Biomphalaria glabrata]XP_055865829.1 tetraspanin-3-like isoform X1 [Biomphalaria glabrata]XP_055865830.1 tetraspanin-3-like isoform X1 [Biomphalaria glabrata]XP_055865831.1 tetraspanin-3-like isoform X1 [Biomphalaria glabrata]
MSAGETCSKIIVVTINLIFLLFGLAALVAGIVFKVGGAWSTVSDFLKIADENSEIKNAGEALALGAIIFGSIIVVIAITGCIGACCKVKCLLVLYGIVVIIILLAEIAVVIVVGVKSSDVENKTDEALLKTLVNYKENSTDDISRAWSIVFKEFKCCGVKGNVDFRNYTSTFYANERPAQYKGSIYYVPITCCSKFNFEAKKSLSSSDFDTNKNCLTAPNSEAYDKGCVKSIINSVLDHKWAFIGVGIAIFFIEILVILLAFCLCCRSDKDHLV